MKRSLSTTLIATAVALVVLTSLLIGTVVIVSLRTYLREQLGHEVTASLLRAQHGEPPPVAPPLDLGSDHHDGPDGPDGPGGHGGPGGPGPGGPPGEVRGQQVGTLTAYVDSTGSAHGDVIAESAPGVTVRIALTEDQLRAITSGARSRGLHDLELPRLGNYLVQADRDLDEAATSSTSSGQVIVGLPTRSIDGVVRAMVLAETLLVLAAAALALLAGRVLVRRQLAPLREVAATADRVAHLPLGSGEVVLAERVPEALADGRTEVGQVGAALNAMLDHVEESLESRERSERQVRQFVADASHELRTPLATIAGYSELARRRPEDQEVVATALAKVEAESGRMAALVEDLLLLARLDQGRPLARDSVDLTHLLLEAVSDARVLAPHHQWRLDLPDVPLEVVGDPLRLHQVVTNLLTNARKYTPDGTTVTVTARPNWVEVHDDGPGLEPDLVAQAFDRFSRGTASRTREGTDPGGHGLGLALVRAIIEAHGGSVQVTSRPGSTSFHLELPADDTSAR